jgi:hypothetical protein
MPTGGTALHAERAGLVGHDGHDALADLLVAQQLGQDPHEGHGGGHLAPPDPSSNSAKASSPADRQRH